MKRGHKCQKPSRERGQSHANGISGEGEAERGASSSHRLGHKSHHSPWKAFRKTEAGLPPRDQLSPQSGSPPCAAAPGLSRHLVPRFQAYPSRSSSAAPLLHQRLGEKRHVSKARCNARSPPAKGRRCAPSTSFSCPASSSWSAAGKGMLCSPAGGCGVRQRKAGIAQKPSHTSVFLKNPSQSHPSLHTHAHTASDAELLPCVWGS